MLLAGCASLLEPVAPAAESEAAPGDGPADAPPAAGDDEEADASAPTEPSPPPSPSPASPGAPAAPSPGAANATAEPAPAPVPYDLAVAFEGQVAAGAFACAPVTCVGGDPSRVNEPFEPATSDALASYALTLTWEATNALAETLTVWIDTCDKDACETTLQAQGTSPLPISVADAGLRGNMRVRVGLSETGAEGVGAAAATDPQPFTLEGILTLLPRAPGSPGWAGHDGADRA